MALLLIETALHLLNDSVSQLLGQGEGDPLDGNTEYDGFAKGKLLCQEARHKLHFLALFT